MVNGHTILPGLGGCAHDKGLEFDVSGTAIQGTNVVVASVRARCANCKAMMVILGQYPIEPSLREATLSAERDMLLVPMVAAGEAPQFPGPKLVMTDGALPDVA